MADDERPEPRTFRPVSPINPSIPRAQTALQNRLAEWAPTLQQLPTPIARSFLAHNQTRAGYGQYPLTNPQAQLALQAALSGQAQTPNPDPGGILDLPRNALEDIRTITTAIPRMLIPNRGNPLYEEAEGLLNLPENIGKAMAEGDNLGEDIQNLSEQPGIRMVPGAYVAGNLASGNADELLAHPVYTALDVLPFASKFVKGLPVNRAAQAGYEAQLMDTVGTPVARGLMSETVNPAVANLRAPGAFRTALTRKLDPATGAVVPNKLGELTQQIGTAAIRSTGATGAAAAMVPRLGGGYLGKANRGVTRLMSQIENEVDLLVNGKAPGALSRVQDPLLQAPLESYVKLHETFPEFIGHSDVLEDLGKRLADGDWSKLNPREQEFALAYRDVTDQAARYLNREERLVTVSEADLKTNRAATLMVGETLPMDRRWASVRWADRNLYRANERMYEWQQKMDQTRQILTGVDDATQTSLNQLYADRGMTLPVPNVPATQSLIEQLQATKFTNPVDADLARQYAAEIRKVGRTNNPRVALNAINVAKRNLQRMKLRKGFSDFDIDMARAEMTDATRWMGDAYKKGTFRSHARAVTRAEARMDKAMLRAAPARFMPNVTDEFNRIVREELDNPRNALTPDEAAMGHAYLDDGVYQGLAQVFGGDQKLIAMWKDQAAQVWMDAKMAGSDPVFQHHVDPRYAADLSPRVSQQLLSESQTKARTFDARPYVGSPSVALDHQMMELVSRRGSEELVETVGKVYGTSEAELMARYIEETGSAAKAQQLIDETTELWPPPTFGPKRKMTNSATSLGDQIRVPKELGETMRTLNDRSKLNAIFDPAMRVFRTAVLPLSPRFQVYNILGGGMMMTVTEPMAWRQMQKAAKALRETNEGGLGTVMKDAYNQRLVPRESTTPVGSPSTGAQGSGYMVSEQMLTAPKSPVARVAAGKSWLQGQKMRGLWDQVQEWKATQPGGKTPFGRTIDTSWTMNQWWDNLYRTSVSLEALQKAGKAGKIGKAAELDAIRATRTVMQNWDELLPLERQVLRSVFPFYSFARFAVGFAMRFPFDHPLRASVMASFARNELEDQGSGLPRDFLGLFQLNQMDEDGNAKFLRLSGFNPFRDTTDWFSVAGFVGQTNPFISATLQSLGVNPMSGGPQLYPNLQFDPETGGLKADTPSFAGALVTSMLPQARIIHNLVIGNEQWDELVQRDPESARRQLQGQLGLPVMTQVENLPQEQIRAEMNRYQMFTDARQEAVKDGKLQELYDTYGDLPINADGQVLSAYIDQLGQLEAAGLLEPLRPQTDARSPAELVRAFGGINRPGPTTGP